jgi:putative ABC transport system permease protein
LRAVLETEPDGAAGGFALGPRSIVRLDALEASGLLAPGTLFDTQYRLALPEGAEPPRAEAEAEGLFADTGMRWRDARNGAPGVQEFVDRIGAFLVLVGLAGLAVGGIGVSSAVRAYLDGKIATIATLKTLGAEARTIFTIYFAQIGLLTVSASGSASPLARSCRWRSPRSSRRVCRSPSPSRSTPRRWRRPRFTACSRR